MSVTDLMLITPGKKYVVRKFGVRRAIRLFDTAKEAWEFLCRQRQDWLYYLETRPPQEAQP
jgi:hypothetical protein